MKNLVLCFVLVFAIFGIANSGSDLGVGDSNGYIKITDITIDRVDYGATINITCQLLKKIHWLSDEDDYTIRIDEYNEKNRVIETSHLSYFRKNLKEGEYYQSAIFIKNKVKDFKLFFR
ncbi:hypothetical protein [Pseudodesulfovibrio senegalensis]|uniref:DUF1425 domain-containing protein n=1 Tax=Pseudodesulfovibrio senegalensis TaxID=1721087 RepID=A0A6N6N5R3_9BACT|nr:hypothetical protein [Pseudodesulfovibrio senegalensis]KAB1443570.1 hypothetical protein F8A88_04810 [Pseudodesulfovibrio senegalensis]